MGKWNGLKTSWDEPWFSPGLNCSFCESTGEVDTEWVVLVESGIIWWSPIGLLVIVGMGWL